MLATVQQHACCMAWQSCKLSPAGQQAAHALARHQRMHEQLSEHHTALSGPQCQHARGQAHSAPSQLPAAAGVEKPRTGKVAELFVYDNFNRVPVQRVEAGDICAFSGLPDAAIGETINNPAHLSPLPSITVRLLLVLT